MITADPHGRVELCDGDRSGYRLAMSSFNREGVNMPRLIHVMMMVSGLAIAGIVVACAA